jgi:hypothetical protein
MYDPLVGWLPRPLDPSTDVLQLNLYLLRDGERIEDVRRSFDDRGELGQILPPVLIVAGLAVVSLRRP